MDLSKLYAAAGKTLSASEYPSVSANSQDNAEDHDSDKIPIEVDGPLWSNLVQACHYIEINPEDAWQALGEDQAAFIRGDIPINQLTAFCHALADTRLRERGERPVHYTKIVHCLGCGPVWLWPDCSDQVLACPWCYNRRQNIAIPRPVVSCEK